MKKFVTGSKNVGSSWLANVTGHTNKLVSTADSRENNDFPSGQSDLITR